MRVLVACEFSGIVRDAFAERGHEAWSCDLLPSERPGNHIRDDVLKHLNDGWDAMIAHPPCTYLCVAGLHYSKKNPERMTMTREAAQFFLSLWNAPIDKIAVENPVGIMNSQFRKPNQIIDPFDFGESERKKTCLWLKGFPPLLATHNAMPKPYKTIIRKSGSKAGKPYNYYWRQGKSGHDRSRTFQCIAKAMAEQWGNN